MRRYFTRNVMLNTREAVNFIRQAAYSLQSDHDLDPLMERIGNNRIVMLGEASHGTYEFYTWRARITRRLVKEKGFNFIAVEGDWPDCYRLNRVIKNYSSGTNNIQDTLRQFNRWPTWMWANWEVLALADWLQAFNRELPVNKKVGFYGLDVYSLWESMQSIMDYLQKTDKAAAVVAEEAFRCFEPYRYNEGAAYAHACRLVPELCENEVMHLLKVIQQNLKYYNTDHEHVFNVEQNALVALHAENYYRTMIRGGAHSWNLRDRHMADTLDRLLKFHGDDSKVVVWAHNSHVGDARATDMIDEGMLNLGEMARLQHHDKGVVLVGFGSYSGSVIAGSKWGAPMQAVNMPPAMNESWEWLLHQAGDQDKLLIMDDLIDHDQFMENHIGHRAIGVVYDPQYEQYGNYVPTILPLRYDAFLFLDETRALYPMKSVTDESQTPETYPFGV